jgi:hypothetical protein
MKAIVKAVLLFADCFFVFFVAISPFLSGRDDRECFWEAEQSFALDSSSTLSVDPH